MANGRPTDAARRGPTRLVVAFVVAIAAGAVALAGMVAAETPPQTTYVSLGLASASADVDGTIHLQLSATNATAAPVDALLSVRPTDASGPNADLWSGTIRADAQASGTIAMSLPGACGRRLSVTLIAAFTYRSLLVTVPCPVAASGAPTGTPNAAPSAGRSAAPSAAPSATPRATPRVARSPKRRRVPSAAP